MKRLIALLTPDHFKAGSTHHRNATEYLQTIQLVLSRLRRSASENSKASSAALKRKHRSTVKKAIRRLDREIEIKL